MSEQIKIDKNVKMPPGHVRGGRPPKYPWRDMVVGDSFLVPESDNKRKLHACKMSAKQYAEKHNVQFEFRHLEGEGWRCWRVE